MADEDRNQQICVGCRTRAPDTQTEYTLISSRFGWRLTRRIERDGTFAMEWRCPACWQRYKTERQLATTPTDGLPAYSGDVPPSSRRPSEPWDPTPGATRKKDK